MTLVYTEAMKGHVCITKYEYLVSGAAVCTSLRVNIVMVCSTLEPQVSTLATTWICTFHLYIRKKQVKSTTQTPEKKKHYTSLLKKKKK